MAEFIDNWRWGGTGTGAYTLRAWSASQVPLIVKGATWQTANLLEAQNSLGTAVFSVDVSGNVTYLGDEYVTDQLTVNGNASIVGTLEVDGATTLAILSAWATTLSSLSVTWNTVLNLATANNITVNNSLIVNSYAYFNRGLYLNEQVTAPTYVAEKGVIYTKDASAVTELFYKDSSGNEVQLTSWGAVGGSDYFAPDDKYYKMGNTTASPDAKLGWNTTQTADGVFFGLSTANNTLIIAEIGDVAYDFAHAAQTNPTIYIQSASQSATQWGSLTHDQTDFLITSGAGAVRFAPATNATVTLPATGKVHIDGTTARTGTTEVLDIDATINTTTATDDVSAVTITAARNSGDTGGTTGLYVSVTTGAQADTQDSYGIQVLINDAACSANTSDAIAYSAEAITADANVREIAFMQKTGWDFAFLAQDGAIQMGDATYDCGTFTMIKGAQTSDPQVQFALSADGNGNFSITADTGDITLTAADDFFVSVDGNIELALTGAALYPQSDGWLTLGITNTNEWAGLYMNASSAISWDNGNYTVTHSAGLLTTNGALTIAGALAGVTTLGMAGDLTDYEAVNDGNPEIRLGSADAEELHIQANYTGGAQTLASVTFTTETTLAGADAGKYIFNVDGADIATIDDGGIEITGSVNATAGFTDGIMTIDGSGAITGVTSLAMGGALSGVTTLGLSQGITQTTTVTGTLYDMVLETEWTTGTLINADFGSATVQSGNMYGIVLDFNTNLAGVSDQDVKAIIIKTPALTQSSANTTNYAVLDVSTAGALVQNTLEGAITWSGINLQMPNITQTTGSVLSYGVYVNGGTVTSGTQWAIFVDSGNVRFDGELTIGNDADNVSGKINFVASDGDAADISINTSDQLVFANAAGGYTFDADIIMAAGMAIRSGSTNGNTLLIGSNDTTFITITSNATDTCVLSGDITTTTQAPADNSTKIATTAYVDAAVGTVNSFAEILALSNTTGANNIVVSTAQGINTALVDDNYFTIGAVDNDTNLIVEVARAQGATDAYFSIGGTQQFKFYNSGIAVFAGSATGDAFIDISPTLTGNASTNTYAVNISPVGITIPTGTTAIAASLYVAEPIFTETGTLTLGANVYIDAAPTEGGTNYSLYSVGAAYFGGQITGNLTGDVTGNCSGTAATVTGAEQASITTCANLTTVGTIATGVWQGTTIKANYLQQAAADLGDVDITVDLSNSNAGNVTNLTIDGTFQALSIGVTGTRIANGFFTDLAVTNVITGSISGNAATVTGITLASGSLTLAGADALTLTTSADTNVTLPTTGTLATLAGTETLTNKRVDPRITTIVSHATPTINTDNCDVVTITAQAEAITSMTTNLSGTPVNFQKLTMRIKDDGTARAITWGVSFEAKGVALPTTTVISKALTIGFLYSTVTSKWGCVATAQET